MTQHQHTQQPRDRGGPHSRRALLLENIHPDAADRLTRAGYTVECRPVALAGEELVAAVGGVEVLGIRSRTQVTAEVLAAAPGLRAVGAFCIGTNQIDLPAAAAQGVAVFNAPHANTRSVAELALAEVIVLTRRLPEHNAAVHAGRWTKTAIGSHEIRGRTLGIVGYGNIGTQLSVLAEALGMRVLFHDLADRLPIGGARRCATLSELLAEADAVSLHVDGRPSNAGLIGASELAAMRPGSALLNLARGSVVDLAALRDVLQGRHLAGAAIDVFPEEPTHAEEELLSDLRGLPNVILTPHIAGSTEQAQRAVGHSVADQLCAHLTGTDERAGCDGDTAARQVRPAALPS